MNIGVVEVKGRRAFLSKFSITVLSLSFFLLPQHALANSADAQFKQYISSICNWPVGVPIPAGWDTATLNTMCTNAASGYAAAGGGPSSSNLGTANAGSGTALRKKKGIRERLDEQQEKPAKGASADGGGWGLLVTPQYGKTNRPDTDLENGYKSELAGLVIGLDYRFSDSFVLGGTIGQTKDNAAFLNNAGWLKTSNNTFTLYGTWLPSENTSVDGYLGYGKLKFDSQRHVNFGLITGNISGSTTGNQVMAGISSSYQTDVGRFSLAPFINLDYIKTSINNYRERGTTTLELRYFDRSTISFSSSLGARMGTSFGYGWGTLLPSARLAAVHEFQNNSKQIRNELVSTPGYAMSVATDAPDRNYLIGGLGVTAALNGGAQLFLDYEKRSQDKLLSSWAVSLGGLVEF